MADHAQRQQQKGIVITIGQLTRAEQALNGLCNQPAPPKLAYHLARLTEIVRKTTKPFYEQRLALIKELGTQRPCNPGESSDDGTMWQVKEEHLATFRERVALIEAEEVSLTDWLLKLNQLTPLQITGNDLQNLGPIVSEDVP